jgi:hypothetical protein
LNRDGRLDFVVAGMFDPQRKSYNTKTRIYWGAMDGTPSFKNVTELEAYGAVECSIADLDRDGNLDLVASNYMSDSTRSLPVFIFWGTAGSRFMDTKRTALPAESSAGTQTLDLNRDGYPELIVHNHLKDGKHSIDSSIYWNSPSGFDPTRRTELPNFGPHFSHSVDPGNLYTRVLEEEYVSAPIEIPAGRHFERLTWKAGEPHGSKIQFQVRLAATRDALGSAQWQASAFFDSLRGERNRVAGDIKQSATWMQYRALFTSADAGEWPIVSDVEIRIH